MGAGGFRLPRRGRARLYVVVAAVGLIALAGLTQIWPAYAVATPDANINDYALFAINHLTLKGGNSGATEIGGNMGVKNADPNHSQDPHSIDVCGGGKNGHPIKVLDGFQVVGDTVSAQGACNFYDLFTNQLTGSPNIRGTQSTFPPPLNLTIPDPGPFACDASKPSNVAKNGLVHLVPGVFGDANWQDGSTVILQTGTYVFCNVSIGKQATVTTADGVVINIEQNFSVDNGSLFGTSCDVSVYAHGTADQNDNDVNFGQGAQVWGTIMAPNGEMALGRDTDLHGRYWGLNIHDDFDMNVHLCTLPSPTTTTSTSTNTSTSTSSSTSTSTSTSTTTTAPTTSTTIADTTTTVPETSTTIADTTTTAAESTTIVTEGTTATTSTTVPVTVTTEGGLVTTTTVVRTLPQTGSSGMPPSFGLASLSAGGALLALTRRRSLRRF